MRRTLLASVALLGLTAGAALAQNSVGSGQNPPAPGAGSQQPQPANSAPTGSVATPMVTPGSNLGTTSTSPMRPAPVVGAPGYGVAPGYAPAPRPPRAPRSRQTRDDSNDPSAPPTSAYRGGAGSPYSPHASNIVGTDTRSVVAPRLPDPAAGANTPEALLSAAQRALNQGKTGAAQEALERAETRILSRTIDPSMADTPDQAAMARHINAARRALGSRDIATAKAEVAAAMSAPVPPRGPTVTTTYPAAPPAYGTPVVGAPAYMPPPGYAPQPGYAAPPGYAPMPGRTPDPGYPPAPVPQAPGVPRTY